MFNITHSDASNIVKTNASDLGYGSILKEFWGAKRV